VPGYYGTNSVKWLWRLHLADRRADGPFTTAFYNDSAGPDDVAAGLPARRPVWATAPESIIVAPAPEAGGAAQPEDGARNAMHTVRLLVR
jgi:sulfane dehydrogenase subunit SoxC